MEMDCGVCWKPDWVAKLKSERALMGGSFSIWESTAMECLWDFRGLVIWLWVLLRVWFTMRAEEHKFDSMDFNFHEKFQFNLEEEG